jgi:hypothetical protein
VTTDRLTRLANLADRGAVKVRVDKPFRWIGPRPRFCTWRKSHRERKSW